jgi:hypothetical protein
MKLLKGWVSLIILFLVLILSSGHAAEQADLTQEAARDNPRAVFLQGVEAYKSSDFAKAVHCFEVLTMLYDSPAAYYDLGNARYQLGDLGRAVVAWKRSLALDPGQDDVVHNLKVVTGSSPWGEGLSGRLREFYLAFSVESLEVFALGFLGLSVLGFFLFRVLGSLAGRTLCLGFLLAALVAGGWAYIRTMHWVVGWQSVILGHDPVAATAGPGLPGEYPKVFTVHPGQIVSLHRSSGPFRQISLPTGAAGWVPRERQEELPD